MSRTSSSSDVVGPNTYVCSHWCVYRDTDLQRRRRRGYRTQVHTLLLRMLAYAKGRSAALLSRLLVALQHRCSLLGRSPFLFIVYRTRFIIYRTAYYKQFIVRDALSINPRMRENDLATCYYDHDSLRYPRSLLVF